MNFKRIIAFASVFAMSCSIFSGFPAGTFDLNMNFYVNAADSIAIDETNFPDDIFRSYVQENFDTDSDGVLSSDELSSVSKINVSDLGIESVKGIEFFTGLQTLSCEENQLTNLDISNNTSLYALDCSRNQLTSLNVSGCSALEELDCARNKLTSLNVSNCVVLEELNCAVNQIRTLDVSGCIALDALYCADNQLTKLDISDCTALRTQVNCSQNLLTSLDISNNTKLRRLYCNDNQIKNLDTSNNTTLNELVCSKNQLTSLDVSKNTALIYLSCSDNQLTSLDVSKNTSLKYIECSSNQLTSLDLTGFDSLYSLSSASNSYHISSTCTYDLSNLPGDFDATKASNWQGATYKNGILTNLSDVITYDYDLGNGKSETFTLTYSPKTLAADDTSSLIDYTYNDDIYSVDVSKYIKIYANTEVDPLLDVNVTGTSDETVSPFDLYWSAYNSGNPTTGFNGTYAFDTNRIDELFDDINEEYGLDLSYDENSDLFIGILYDDSGNARELSSFACKIAQRGDANLDHTVDTKDASAIAKYTAQSAILSDVSMNSTDNELGVFAGDTNGDGTIDAKDAANVAKFTAQKALCSPDIPEAQSYWEIWNNILG